MTPGANTPSVLPVSGKSPARIYLHGFPSPDAHHFHREAPPVQQDAGSTLMPEFAAADSVFDLSATLGPATGLGLGRGSEASFADREAPIVISASPAPLGARDGFADLASAINRRSADGAGGLGGKALFAALTRVRCIGGCAGARLGISSAASG